MNDWKTNKILAQIDSLDKYSIIDSFPEKNANIELMFH